MLRSFINSTVTSFSMVCNSLLNAIDTPVIILLYHRVTRLPFDPQMLAVNQENFRSHMQFLKNNYTVLRIEDDLKGVSEPSVVITFDDGYADNLLEALPILEEVGVPATFFVNSGGIEGKCEFWWDELEHIILNQRDLPEFFELRDNCVSRRWNTETEYGRRQLYSDMHSLMKIADSAERDSWLKQLRRWARTEDGGRESHRAMSLDELRRLARSRWVTIGAHAISHTALSALSPENQHTEIAGSKDTIEKWLEKEIAVFSYPFGTRTDYNKTSVNICKQAGLLKAASNFPGQVHRWTDPYQLPRHLVRNWPLDYFSDRINRFWLL